MSGFEKEAGDTRRKESVCPASGKKSETPEEKRECVRLRERSRRHRKKSESVSDFEKEVGDTGRKESPASRKKPETPEEKRESGFEKEGINMNWWNHLKTINHHKWLVMKSCFRLGMYKQGLLHDLSKYSPTEFLVGVKYYQGNRSPNNAEREDKGYTSAWLHHKGRNKHHLEYWLDYDLVNGGITGMRMPVKYVVEMFCDRVAASKNYNKENYTDQMPLEYYKKGKSKTLLHPESAALLEKLLTMLAKQGEDATFDYIKREILTKEVRREKI